MTMFCNSTSPVYNFNNAPNSDQFQNNESEVSIILFSFVFCFDLSY